MISFKYSIYICCVFKTIHMILHPNSKQKIYMTSRNVFLCHPNGQVEKSKQYINKYYLTKKL